MEKMWLFVVCVCAVFTSAIYASDTQFEVGKSYHGFILEEQQFVQEINATARIFRHEKSGARLMYLSNDDENKAFVASFTTLPASSNGIAHILEHSVLCGSRKFPSKEPFVELNKGSLNTFLNAMTGSDRTSYPVASMNAKDFRNLMDVYLDAVFFPNIHSIPEILMQEGWHYELDSIDAPLVIRGVVYNEMKGVYSSPDNTLFNAISGALFPATPYRYDSGGDPSVIPTLTQEEFSAFHKKYYHPSNAFLYLYGDGDVADDLAFIDKEYLSLFTRSDETVTIPIQQPFNEKKDLTVYYPSAQGMPVKNRAYLSYSIAMTGMTPEEREAFDVIHYVFFGNPSSPMRKTLMDSGIGKSCYGYFESSMQSSYTFVMTNADASRKDEFEKIITTTLESLAKNGIDKKLIESSINSKEFRLREASYNRFPKGLVYNFMVSRSIAYGGHPLEYLAFEKHFLRLKDALEKPYLESLITKYLLDNPHAVLITALPEPGQAEKDATLLAEKLAAYKKTLSKKDLQVILDTTKNLKKRQNTPDTAEVLASIPQLTRDDLNKTEKIIPSNIKSLKKIPIIHTPQFTNNIMYSQLVFDTSAVPKELIHYIPLMVSVMRKMNTEKYAYGDLANEINIQTGGISIGYEVFAHKNGKDYMPALTVTGKSVYNKAQSLFDLEYQILLKTIFSDTVRLKEILHELRADMDQDVNSSGLQYASLRVRSSFTPYGAYNDHIDGVPYLMFIRDIDTHYDSIMHTIVKNLKKTAGYIFNASNLTIGVTIPEEDYATFEKSATRFIADLPSKKGKKQSYVFETSEKNEAFYGTSKVNYVYMGYNAKKLGFEYNGTMHVLRNILRNDFLWNRVRVQGGAYGAQITIQRDGTIIFGSYRDPNLAVTIKNYKDSLEYVKNFTADEREMTKYIIGSIGDLDQPLSAQMKGTQNLRMYLTGMTYDDYQRERNEVLSVTPEKIRAHADMLQKVINASIVSVFGGETEVMKNKDMFSTLTNLEK